MEVYLADKYGFCGGVNRAVKLAFDRAKEGGEVYILGELVHNQRVVEDLQSLGVLTIDEAHLPENATVITRSHGIVRDLKEELTRRGNTIIDTTCPYVKRVQEIVAEESAQGNYIVLLGKRGHPEVEAIASYGEVHIVESEEEARELELSEVEKIILLSQTTNPEKLLNRLEETLKEVSNGEVFVYNTICKATLERQEATRKLAQGVDCMLVVGGLNSANTKKLVGIAKEECEHVFHIQTIEELDLRPFKKFNKIGITAGASTPDTVIKEAVSSMENLNNEDMNREEIEDISTEDELTSDAISHEEVTEVETEEKSEETTSDEEMTEQEMSNEMMEAIDNSFTRVRRGEVVEGEVLYVTDEEVMVNIGYRADGIISRDELSNDSDQKPSGLFEQGDTIPVYVLKMDDGDGNVVLSYKRVANMKLWDEMEEKFNEGELVTANVKSVVKGGLTCDVDGLNGFIPASHVSVRFQRDLNRFVGEELLCEIIDFDKTKRKFVLSRKNVEAKEIEEKKKEVYSNIQEGDVIKGTVQRLTNFGAFVDIGGVDGLIHISELSWNRVKHPSDVVSPGQEVEVQVLKVDEESNRIALGLKQTTQKPWDVFTEQVSVGDVVKGKVVNLLDFGAFVRLESGVDGLLHVSQISREHIEKPSDVLEIGQEIEVEVTDINEDDKKISLSIKSLTETPEEKEREKKRQERPKREPKPRRERPVQQNTFQEKDEGFSMPIGDLLNLNFGNEEGEEGKNVDEIIAPMDESDVDEPIDVVTDEPAVETEEVAEASEEDLPETEGEGEVLEEVDVEDISTGEEVAPAEEDGEEQA